MARQLDYHSREYDELVEQAKRLGWNEDNLNSTDLENAKARFNDALNLSYNPSDEVQIIKRISRGERS